MKGFFITGTDTDAGKTYVSSLVIKALREAGLNTLGYKPICCGGREDAYALQAASGGEVELDRVNPLWMRTAAAPYVASMFEKTEFSVEPLLQGARDLGEQCDVLIAEGVGGWMVPIQKDYMVGDFAKDLGLPTVLVVGNRLGALNHTMLTIQSMRATGVEPVGLIFNNLIDELDTATITNKGIIEDLTGVPVLLDVIRDQEEIESWPLLDLLGVEANV